MEIARRPNLSEEIRSLVRERVVNGSLPPAARINEVRLADELRVSRTPLREALTALVGEGALTSVPRRGFFVRPLSIEEFLNVYPIRALLDPEALRLSGVPSPERIDRLEQIDRRLREESDPERRIRLDDAWHMELLADCPNPVLLDLIRQFMLRTRRYELCYFRETHNLERSLADHERVIAAARRGDMQAALAALADNLTRGIAPIVEWLKKRDASGGIHSPETTR